ncbi:MAG: SPOR domain-containing protein, partial [Pararhizobium sp.]
GPTVPASGVAAAPLAPPSASAEPVHAPVPTIRPEQQAAAAPVAPAPAAPANPPAAQGPAPQASEPPPAATAAATPQQAAPANPGGYFIQIASQPTEAGAKASYQNLSRRYSSVIGGHGVDIQRAEITGKGVYYRVRVAAGSREQAISLCESYKSVGGSCFVTH